MKAGLYHPDQFKDNCGFGLIAHMQGEASHHLLKTAIEALTCMTHRGGINADGKTGDGCGLLLQKPDRFLRALASFPKPLVAAVCGPAVGIGTTMLLHCDLVYAGDNAAFALPFVNLGLCPEAGSSLLLAQTMGYHRAAEALLLGEPFFAEAALEVGLVNRVVPPTECNSVAQAQARKLAAKPLASLIATKRLMKQPQHQRVLDTISEEAQVFAQMLQEPAAREAFGAFMEKRRPDFSQL